MGCRQRWLKCWCSVAGPSSRITYPMESSGVGCKFDTSPYRIPICKMSTQIPPSSFWSVSVVATGFVLDLYVVGQYRLTNRSNNTEEEDQRPPKAAVSPRSRHHRRRYRPIFSGDGHLSDASKVHIGFVTEILATTMETAIFAYLGLFLFSSRLHWNTYHSVIGKVSYRHFNCFKQTTLTLFSSSSLSLSTSNWMTSLMCPCFTAILGCCVSRAIMIPALGFFANWITRVQQVGTSCPSKKQQLPLQETSRKSDGTNNPAGVVIDKKMQLVLWFAGLRGKWADLLA